MKRERIEDIGVSTNSSTILAHIPSAFAKSALFCLAFAGYYSCDQNYRVDRSFFNLFSLMYVKKGRLFCRFEGKDWFVEPGQIILMDCKKPHVYASVANHTEFQWLHFYGITCQAYYDMLKEEGLLLSSVHSEMTTTHISFLIQMMEQPTFQEQTASLLIHTILRNISEPISQEPAKISPMVNLAIIYMHEHLAEILTLDELANQASMSKYHFIRAFKQATGSTPHEFLVNLRLKRAMELLTNTILPIEVVATQCGFGSASYFSRAFRNSVGKSASEFRLQYAANVYGLH